MLCYDDSVIDFYAYLQTGNGDRLDIPDISAPPRKPAGSGSFPGEPGHTLFKIVSSVRGYHV